MTGTDARSPDGSVACPRCRTENPSSHRFCVECGQALPSACPRCGFVRDPGARFCGGCGQPIGITGCASSGITGFALLSADLSIIVAA